MNQSQTAIHTMFLLIARLFMGRGIDKRFPLLVSWYKKLFALTSASTQMQVGIAAGQKLWVSSTDAGLGLMLRTSGVFEPLQTAWWLDTVKKGMTVVDVGANVGYYTVLAGTKTNRLVAIEPEPTMFALLKKNAPSSAKLFNVALGDAEGYVGLVADENPGETKIDLTEGSTKMTTFSKLVTKADVIKIDVEGAEPLVLSGIKKGSIQTLICECNPTALADFGFTVKDLLTGIRACGLQIAEIIDERAGEQTAFSMNELNTRLERSSFVSLIARAK